MGEVSTIMLYIGEALMLYGCVFYENCTYPLALITYLIISPSGTTKDRYWMMMLDMHNPDG